MPEIGNFYALKDVFNKEKEVARMLVEHFNYGKFHSKNKRLKTSVIMEGIEEFEKAENITLDEQQKQAVVIGVKEPLSVITGGPGTGKTSTLKCILYCIQKCEGVHYNKMDIMCLAPTGKAARRMKEATGRFTQTILGWIEYNPMSRNTVHFYFPHFIFIDECSMMDLDTLYYLLKAADTNAYHLCLIGDEDQLPSVGKGSILRDMIASNLFPMCRLTKTFRQAEDSTLFKNIQLIRKGLPYNFIDGSDFEKYSDKDMDGFLPLYYSEVFKRGLCNVCILTPTRKAGRFCSEALNNKIQAKLRGKQEGITVTVKRDGRNLTLTFKEGDPVMHLVNSEVANGEVGFIVQINTKEEYVIARYQDRDVKYYKSQMYQLDLAYAISIHKAQGSEYPCVFCLFTTEGQLDRNMIYTAVTRAKKKCVVFGNYKTISDACKIQSSKTRATSLVAWMKRYMKETKTPAAN